MKRYSSPVTAIAAAVGMLVLIMDSRTALSGASEGIALCIKTVIPALFPFFLLSALLTNAAMGAEFHFLQRIGQLCGIPKGSESILLTGLLGGYPVGAQSIAQTYAAGQLRKEDARRMLGFCSNAGPAFIFGISSVLFENRSVPLILWLIHIVSALVTGILLPYRSLKGAICPLQQQIGIGQALHKSLSVTGTVCGWVIIFRILLSFLSRWFMWLLSPMLQIILTGLLELTNGYIRLAEIDNNSLRFVLASIFLAAGGICVCLQTVSITGQVGLDMGYYFKGKAIQTIFSTVLALIVSGFLFDEGYPLYIQPLYIILAIAIIAILLIKRKNSSSIPAPSVV